MSRHKKKSNNRRKLVAAALDYFDESYKDLWEHRPGDKEEVITWINNMSNAEIIGFLAGNGRKKRSSISIRREAAKKCICPTARPRKSSQPV